ncbi:MAG: ABC transporter permease [Clostridia bacterium]|nr:ABC transporter permease [Clostridia bacterium]
MSEMNNKASKQSPKAKKKFDFLTFVVEHREIPLLAVLALLLIVVTLFIPTYLKDNYVTILRNSSINLVMAAGMLCVLLIGSIDISVAAVLELAAVVAGVLMRGGQVSSILGMFAIGIGIGIIAGLINGTLVSFGRVLPIIVTLGMTYLARGLIPMNFLLGMEKISSIDLVDPFKSFILQPVLGIPLIVYIALAVVLIIGLFLKYTTVGRSIYATGSNPEAAQMRGVKVKWIKVLAHVICGATAGMAGIMRLGFYNAIEKNAATGQEMYVIAACVLGGVSVMGGYGKITGVVVGAILVATIDSAIPQLFTGQTMMTDLFKGLLILAAILLNVLVQRATNKRNLLGRGI